MSFRFRKILSILPGLKIHLSKSGASLSVGKPGATINLKPGRAAKGTIGIPGSGFSWSENLTADDWSPKVPKAAPPAKLRTRGWFALFFVIGFAIATHYF